METFSARGALPLIGRLGVVVAATFALSGCFLPPMLSLATTSANVITWAATGKTATDHAYSAVARSDCSSFRILVGKPMCIDPPAAGTAVAATDSKDAPADAPAPVAMATAPPLQLNSADAVHTDAVAATPVTIHETHTASLGETHVAGLVPAAPRTVYVTIGSFLDRSNAERSLAQFAPYHASIVPATVNGRLFNRVVAGPLTADEAAALRGRVTVAANKAARAG